MIHICKGFPILPKGKPFGRLGLPGFIHIACYKGSFILPTQTIHALWLQGETEIPQKWPATFAIKFDSHQNVCPILMIFPLWLGQGCRTCLPKRWAVSKTRSCRTSGSIHWSIEGKKLCQKLGRCKMENWLNKDVKPKKSKKNWDPPKNDDFIVKGSCIPFVKVGFFFHFKTKSTPTNGFQEFGRGSCEKRNSAHLTDVPKLWGFHPVPTVRVYKGGPRH